MKRFFILTILISLVSTSRFFADETQASLDSVVVHDAPVAEEAKNEPAPLAPVVVRDAPVVEDAPAADNAQTTIDTVVVHDAPVAEETKNEPAPLAPIAVYDAPVPEEPSAAPPPIDVIIVHDVPIESDAQTVDDTQTSPDELAEDNPPAAADDARVVPIVPSPPARKTVGGIVPVPAAKRPRAPDREKCEAAALNDESENTAQEYRDTLKYGAPSDIVLLIDKFIKNDDPRFVDEVYDVFQATKSSAVRDKALEYFTHFDDPCLADYAVTVVNDPYDTRDATVSLVFKYLAEIDYADVSPAVIRLLELDDVRYFEAAVSTLGEIGGANEALYLADYIDRDDLTIPQRQALARALGKLSATETWEKLITIAQNEDENTFVRMYSAEAIGAMQKDESVPILANLYESSDPNLRQYVIKGLANFPKNEKAREVIMQGVRDEHWRVRLEAIDAVKNLGMTEAVPTLIYRAKNDAEKNVKTKCYDAIAALGTSEGSEYLISILNDDKASDTTKAEAAAALLKNNEGERDVLSLATAAVTDDKRKPLRYAIGKELAKYGRASYSDVCALYLASKDTATVSLGLDIYQKGRYASLDSTVRTLAEGGKNNANATRAKRILGIDGAE